MTLNSKFLSEFLHNEPGQSAKIGATFMLSAFCNYDFFVTTFNDVDVDIVCRVVSCICYLCNDKTVFEQNHYLDFDTANLSTIHDYIVKYCELLGKK